MRPAIRSLSVVPFAALSRARPLAALGGVVGTVLAAVLAGVLGAAPASGQQPVPRPAQVPPPVVAASRLTIDRIFKSSELASAPLPEVRWLKDGRSYLETRANPAGGVDIVRVDLTTGVAQVLVDAKSLVDERGRPIEVEEITLSDDESKALLFHNSVRVWRTNTRGVYHVVDFRTKRVTPVATITTPGTGASTTTDSSAAPFLGQRPRNPVNPGFIAGGLASGAADPDLQMFAKFSPDGRQVAFVRGNDLHVTDLATGRERRLTTDGSDDVINGTTDWVYEEELDLRDAFRWSPDSKRIAYWRFDQSRVPAYPITDELPLYPRVGVLRYPVAGAPNSRVRVGVLDVAGAGAGRPTRTRWLDVGGDTGLYVARMEWVGSDSLAVLRLPRRQNRADVLLLSAATGRGRTVLTERDSAYVDVGDEPVWFNGGRQFLWSSDRSGWRQVYLYNRDGSLERCVTQDGMDVLGVVGVDEARGDVYVQAAAPTPTQRQIFRYSLSGKGGAQVTSAPGSHAATIGPGARYLVDTYSTASQPATRTAYALPSMTRVRVLEDNARLRSTLSALSLRGPEFFRVPMPDGAKLDAYRIVPAGFDSTKRYPVLMYVYGGPAAPTVNDAWGGQRYLWHQLLAQHGYVVVSVDNRGAAWRGRDFRKVTQLRLGQHESQDQIDAAKWLGAQPWVDPKRIGMWGWSYGGYMTTLTAARGGDLFRAAIAVAPLTDWRFYDTIYTERYMWTPQANPEGYKAGAPLNYVEGLRAKFLVAHGTGDDNVHPQNTIQLAERLEAAGRPFYMLLYPNRTHSISGGNSTAHLYDSMLRFVLENL
jgi:dipeptidyl-peptidase 4